MNLKFRGYDSKNKKFLDIEGLGFSQTGHIDYILIEDPEAPKGFRFIDNFVELAHIQIVQSTGLYDMHNREIFIGDILQVWKSETTYMIKEVIDLNGACRVTTFDVLTHDLAKKSCIVGNIMENRHLLEG